MFVWFFDIFSLIVRMKSGFIWVRGIECETFTLWGRKTFGKEKKYEVPCLVNQWTEEKK